MKFKYKSVIYNIGVLVLAAAILNKLWWIYVCTIYTAFEDCKAAYLSFFPKYLQNAFLLTVIEIFLLAIAAIIFSESKKAGYQKKISKILMIISLILCGWNLFSLM
jgi:glycerol uptake facilitator-like aquaporin